MTRSELEQYREYVSTRLSELSPLLENYAVGDFSESIQVADEEDEFTELLVGLSLMVDDIREMMQEREDTIAKLQRAEEALRATKQRYESLVENIPDAVYSALPDETGTTTFMSGRWEDWTGYAPEDFYRDHETWPKSIHPDDLGSALGGYVGACRTGHDYISEYRVVHKDTGEVRWVRDHGVPFKDDKGNVVRFDGIVTDITERKQAEHAVARHVAELERFNRLAVGRELRMIELKRQVNALSEQLGKAPPYDLSFVGKGGQGGSGEA